MKFAVLALLGAVSAVKIKYDQNSPQDKSEKFGRNIPTAETWRD